MKKIVCFILATLMLIGSLPLAAIAAASTDQTPVVIVSSLYSYQESDPNEFRALPDLDGRFYLDISLSKVPTDGSEVVVYYRTVDDSAVAKWGDYESVGVGASVILNRANGYKARVTVESQILGDGFYTSDDKGEPNRNKLVTRRFLFELTSVEGAARLKEDQNKLYCYLRSSLYHYQNQNAQMDSDQWKSKFEVSYWEFVDLVLDRLRDEPGNKELAEEAEYFLPLWEDQWNTITKNSNSLYYTIDGSSALNTPRLQYGKQTSHSDSINMKFDEEWQSYVQSGWCDLGISIDGTCTRSYWDSDGEATFNLYYYYGGEKKLALTLYLEGEFDDSTFFGWEHAFEYAIDGSESNNKKDHMNDNFIGFTVYDNDGKEAYTVMKNSSGSVFDVCNQLNKTLIAGNAVKMLSGFQLDDDVLAMFLLGATPFALNSYYLRLPSNFVLADSYSYEFISHSTDDDEIRWLEDVKLSFTLMGNETPAIAKNDKGNQMVTTNLDTMKEGDPLRMSVRFDRPVHIADPNGNCYITVDIHNDKGACLAKGVKLTLKQLADADSHYAWDTLVFEGAFPSTMDGTKIASLRNIKIVDGTEDEKNPTTEGIKSFFTERKLISKGIRDIYIDRDFRTPIATVTPSSATDWAKSKSLDVYVNAEGGGRFNDYVTVYYQWSNSKDIAPTTYSSKVIFHTGEDGEVLKTIIGTGSGEMYLYLKAVSAYGKSSVSGPFGPFKFDNAPPMLTAEQITISGNLKESVISIPLPDDSGGSGIRDVSLYYVKKNGEEALLKNFTADKFEGDPKTLTHTISHRDVGVGVDAQENVVLAREKVTFYWVLTDKLGNTSGKLAEFALVFDTSDYISEDVMSFVGPLDFMGYNAFIQNPEMLAEKTYLYDYKDDHGSTVVKSGVYYGFGFEINGRKLTDDKKDYYDIIVSYNGKPLTKGVDYTVEYRNIVTQMVSVEGESTKKEIEVSWQVALFLKKEIESGRYDIRLVRSIDPASNSKQLSQIYTVYATANENDSTEIKNKIEFGTLLSNTVYQLSTENPFFYYKDANGAIQKVYYNDTKQPATFSSFEKAKEYVYYKELGDIYPVQLSATTASALSGGTGGYLLAKGETMVPQAGQYWIRYKSEAWTPTSGESAWVYYYYGESAELTEGALSANLLKALNTVSTRIAGYGKSIVLTDTSLFLDTAMGEKLLDGYGMPYLAPGQIHVTDELSGETACGIKWSSEVAFAADKNIYKSKISIGEEGTATYREYPIVGNFSLPEDSIFQYKTLAQYEDVTSSWQTMNIENGKSFVDVLEASGVYWIREISTEGVSVYAIYIDKGIPDVTFFQTDESGNFKEIPVDEKEVLDIRTKDLYIGSISPNEPDRLSYVAVYKATNLSLIGVYTAGDLESTPIQLEDGNYYLVVADRSGNHYTVTAKVSSTLLECNIRESVDKYIRLTCNRRSDQIQIYEVYLNGTLVTSTYMEDQTFTKAGLYSIYVQDIYGNEFSKEYLFERNYPTVTWKYYGSDGKYHAYDPSDTNANGFVLTWVVDNQYKISTAVQTRFSFSGDYAYEFIGTKPKHTETMGAETTVTIEAGQSFTLKVYYKNHKDCYSIYSGMVDVTPPSINVSADLEVFQNGEYSLFDDWAQKGNVGDVIVMKDLYYELAEIAKRSVENGGSVSSDIIKINASDANDVSLIEVYLDGALLEVQDVQSGFSQIIVNRWGKYRVVAKDTLGNVAEFTFTNGMPDYFDYFVDGAEKEQELHGYLNFDTVGDQHVYTKLDFGNKDFKLNVKQSAELFMSVGVSGEAAEIYGFEISNGRIYPLTYKIVLDKNGNKAIDLVAGEAILDMNVKDFKTGQEYLISKSGAYAVYASIALDKTVSIKVYVPEDSEDVVSVSARIEDRVASHTSFVSAELSKRCSEVTLDGLGVQTKDDVRINSGFTVDESTFESERISSISLYYSKLNDLDASNLDGKTNLYVTDREYDDEGFYLLIVQNHYGNKRVYRIAISRSFGITSSVTFGDGHKIFYSKDYHDALYSNSEIILDLLDMSTTVNVTLNGAEYTGFVQKQEGEISYLVFSEEGTYEVKLTDSYGNQITRRLEINKSTYTIPEALLTGYNDKALRREEGYTNQKLSVDKTVYDSAGIYYLAVQYGETLTVLFDAFAENAVAIDESAFVNAIGSNGDGVYKVICRNRYGAIVTKEIHYRGTPTLKLERTTRSSSESEVYDLSYAVSLGFWSNNTLIFSTDAKTYVFTVDGSATECPRTLVFENVGEFGNYEYEITYLDEYGFEYSFKAYLVRKNVDVDLPSGLGATEIDGVLNTKNDIFMTFGETIYATYTRNNGDEVTYHSGDVLKKDGTYRFTVMDYAGNATTLTIKKDTAVEFSFIDSISGNVIQNGSVVNSSKIDFDSLNKDGVYIEKIVRNGVVQADFTGSKFNGDGKWEMILCDKLGNRAYFCFYIITHAQNGFSYTTPYEYRITEMWYDSGDGVKISCMNFVNHTDFESSFDFKENGTYTVVMTSNVTGSTSTFEFTVNTNAPNVSLVGCNAGETTINDVTLTGYQVGDRIRIYRAAESGEELVQEIEITSLATKIPTVTEGGKYRIVVESEAGVQTELSFVRKHVMNTAGSVFIMVVIGLSVIGLFTGLVYRNKSKTDD